MVMLGTRVQSLGQEEPREKEVVTHSSILAWEIPWTEKTGRIPTVHGVTKNLMKLSKLNNSNTMTYNQGFPADSSGKDSACSAGDTEEANSSPALERSPGVGNGSPLQNSSLENPMDFEAWWGTAQSAAKNWT